MHPVKPDEPIRIDLTLDQTTGVICEKCKSKVFSEGILLRKISKHLTGGDKDNLYPIPVFYCIACKHVNKEFLPELMREEND